MTPGVLVHLTTSDGKAPRIVEYRGRFWGIAVVMEPNGDQYVVPVECLTAIKPAPQATMPTASSPDATFAIFTALLCNIAVAKRRPPT